MGSCDVPVIPSAAATLPVPSCYRNTERSRVTLRLNVTMAMLLNRGAKL